MTHIVVYYETFTGHRGWRWLPELDAPEIHWTTLCNADSPLLDKVRKPLIGRYVGMGRILYNALFRNADLIVCHTTIAATWLGILKKIFRFKADIMAFAYTHPKWDEYPEKRKAFFRQGAPYIDRFVMFSSIETRKYPQVLGVPADRFDMIHWAVNPPQVDTSAAPLVAGRYISAIGGEGRDYVTLVEAMRGLPEVQLAIVARPENLAGIDLPDNVKIFTNIPFADAMSILLHSDLTVLPLLSSTVPCGHGTLLSGFLLGVPTIVTASEAMQDYVEDGVTVITAKERDAISLRDAIQRIWQDADLRKQLSTAGESFAKDHCSHEVTVSYFRQYLVSKGLLSR